MFTNAFRPASALRALGAAALLTAPALAGVYVVDDDGGPGVDFTDLPAAVAAALPGDVLLVQPGTYTGFTTWKGIAVLAQDGGVAIASATSLASLPAGQTARLVGVELTTLALNGCQGVVVLDGVAVRAPSSTEAPALDVAFCPDVRVFGSTVSGSFVASHQQGDDGTGLKSWNARVEIVHSGVYGGIGFTSPAGRFSGNGGHGATIGDGSRVHLVLSEAAGGKGGNGSSACLPWWQGGDGGDGAQVVSSALFAMGTPAVSGIKAGLGGSGSPLCSQGAPGKAFKLQTNSYARHSGQTISGHSIVDASSTLETPALLDPYMERFGTLEVGTQVRFNVFGEVGDQVTLFLGRNAVVQPLPGVLIEKLTSEERAFPLGPIPAEGVVSFVFPMPPWMTSGFTFYAQARVMRGSEELRTNSIPVVVR